MKKRWISRILALGLLIALPCITVSLATDAGTANDPLVTLSYLNDTFLPQILGQVDDKIAVRNSQMSGQLASAGDVFQVVTLQQGQSLNGTVGCEVMLRIGTAACTASSAPGLVDETSADTIDNGAALIQNHLYLMTIDNRSIQATSATVKLMVRGTYTIH